MKPVRTNQLNFCSDLQSLFQCRKVPSLTTGAVSDNLARKATTNGWGSTTTLTFGVLIAVEFMTLNVTLGNVCLVAFGLLEVTGQ